jgi:hypothetical protein
VTTRHRTSTLDKGLESARQELSALEREGAERDGLQQAEYRRRMEVKADSFRPKLARFLNLFSQVRELDDDWRRQVFRGEEPFDPEVEHAVRTLYAVWFAYSPMYQEHAEYLNRHTGNLNEELDALGRQKREADRALRTWEPPVPSAGPSFRAQSLSAETTARLRELFRGKA